MVTSLYSDMLEMQNWKAIKTVVLNDGTEFDVRELTSVTRDSVTFEVALGEILVPKSSIAYAILERKEPL
jgi:hypothetical protein